MRYLPILLLVGCATPFKPIVQRCYINVDTVIEMEHKTECKYIIQYINDAVADLHNRDLIPNDVNPLHGLTFHVRDSDYFYIGGEAVQGHFDPFTNTIELVPIRPCVVIHELLHKWEWDHGGVQTINHWGWGWNGYYAAQTEFCKRIGVALWVPEQPEPVNYIDTASSLQ